MIGELIAIGDELTSGRVTNTTSGYAARQLFLLGYEIRAMHTIGDDLELIGTTLKEALTHADFVLITGGLGATTDDLTNEAVIRALGLATAVHLGVRASIATRWPPGRLGDAVSLDKLSLLPEGAEMLDSEYRMAGYLLRHKGKLLFLLPGVPPQMETLLASKVIPILQALSAERALPVSQRVYRTCGLKEVEINKRLLDLEADKHIHLGYYPVRSEVHISLLLRNLAQGMRDPLFVQTDRFIRSALGNDLYGIDGETLASVVGRLLQEHGLVLGIAESCTGGLLSSTITTVEGSSGWFAGGVVAYANGVKESLLGVEAELLVRCGAVSGETARAMAAGAAAPLGCDITVAVTGVAGPGGGTAEKPVGTVYIGLYHRGRSSDQRFCFSGTRRQVQEKTTHTALDLVRRALLKG
ncbi:MAG: CinA family nicotinamide mononucleotide deamidase-related protein [Desulfobulbus sp.]|jgi:nicotinamide-nucleotide amidase|nr:CinA family nicotinamide mononucleotide deamidase-related protein [Desulfobulbus sp.]